MTQAFWLAALKTDGPVIVNITGSCYSRVANTAWPSYHRIARSISNKFAYLFTYVPCSGATAKHADVQVHRVLPWRSVRLAEETVDGRHGHHNLDGGPADLVASREHLHRLGGHQETASRGLGSLRQDRRRLQGDLLLRFFHDFAGVLKATLLQKSPTSWLVIIIRPIAINLEFGVLWSLTVLWRFVSVWYYVGHSSLAFVSWLCVTLWRCQSALYLSIQLCYFYQ